ncbi:MAG: hypothetical protein V5B33_14235 [Candidatus Accumulibacter sp. UW20]
MDDDVHAYQGNAAPIGDKLRVAEQSELEHLKRIAEMMAGGRI